MAPRQTTNAEMGAHLGEHDAAVLECLRGARTHPTAAEVYDAVRTLHPRIGRATVYRALARLEAAGLTRSVGRDALGQHYDARTERHDHAICTRCGAVRDLSLSAELPTPIQVALSQAARAAGIAPASYEIRLYGRCVRCAQADEEYGCE